MNFGVFNIVRKNKTLRQAQCDISIYYDTSIAMDCYFPNTSSSTSLSVPLGSVTLSF